MSDIKKHDEHVLHKSRRKVLKGLAAGIGLLAMPGRNASASVWEDFFQKHFRELSREELKGIVARDRGRCHLCRKPVRPGSKAFDTRSFDHLIPVLRGGPWAEWNLALAHVRCNQRRGSRRVLAVEDRPSAEAYIRRLSEEAA